MDGSSPRERGTRSAPSAGGIRMRFIPAGAGNASRRCAGALGAAVHPRGSGERSQWSGRGVALSGFIPAGAGNAPSTSTARTSIPGSSPRERGTPPPGCRRSIPGRFIPAGAGNAASPWWSRALPTVHPRGSGEREIAKSFDRPTPGSSPRERGTQPTTVRRGVNRRFIPAGAGNARPAGSPRTHTAVHPRGSGERRNRERLDQPNDGSSPRERGTPSTRRGASFLSAVHPRGSGERGRFD